MTKINHSRPCFKYGDNLKREVHRALIKHSKSGGQGKSYGVDRDNNAKYIFGRMEKIYLTDFESRMVLNIHDLYSEYLKLDAKWMKVQIESNKNERIRNLIKSIIKERDDVYEDMQDVVDYLTISEAQNMFNGRNIGVTHWWALYERYLIEKESSISLFVTLNYLYEESFTRLNDGRLDIKKSEIQLAK